MKFRFLLCLISFSIFSCSETVKNTSKEKDYSYLKSENNKIATQEILAKKAIEYELKIEKVDSLITYKRLENYHKLRYETLFKKYKPTNIFESKLVPLGSGEMFIQSASIKHERFSFPEKNNYQGYIVKKLTQNYRNVYAEGNGDIKISIQIFPVNQEGKVSDMPLYKIQAYGNEIERHINEGYFLSSQYGCCTSTNTYELFDLQGNYILSSNNSIKSIVTNNKTYYIGMIQSEYTVSPVLFIKDIAGNTQYVQFSGTAFDAKDHFEYYIKYKDQQSPYISKYTVKFSQYEVNKLDDLELWLPINEKDTLKIPFKNEKAFGIDYPQLKVTLQNKK
ncbi:hypothetical protein IMCC3317_00870 [Kordia antarctica]|uniref:Lipoprotein n=1 Tax=Kordia antarctica TaxID=1218801 RepID=A0A7L4ZCX4_9FLAO|nr:hypothetical protein [Kordia antarctica]QHI34743.1 hypothetical protein IMCC3317_00870 [Kordia antarctica]